MRNIRVSQKLNYEWLDLILGCVGSLTQRLDVTMKKMTMLLNSLVIFGHVLEALHGC